MRRKALREPELSLDDLLYHGRTLELSKMQATGMEKDTAATINKLTHKASEMHPNKNNWSDKQHSHKSYKKCGGKYPHIGECPDKNEQCPLSKTEPFCKAVHVKICIAKGPEGKCKEHSKKVHPMKEADEKPDPAVMTRLLFLSLMIVKMATAQLHFLEYKT